MKKNFWYIFILLLVLLAITFKLTNGFKFLKFESNSKGPIPFVNVYFDDEEVFPVYLIYLRNTGQGLMELTITNPDIVSKTVKVTYGFVEFGGSESKSVFVENGSVIKVQITPYSPKLNEVFSPVNATILVKVTDEKNTKIFNKTWSLKVCPGDEIPWKIRNRDCTNLIASFVTPENKSVEGLMTKAKNKTRGKNSSVNNLNDDDFRQLVKNLFNTVKDEGITYTNNPISFGDGSAQRIRLPNLTLQTKSANSIDGSVLLASLFEDAGLRAYIVILSDHAIVGVARPNHENDKIFIETFLLGRSTLESIFSLETTFTAAIKSWKEEYNKAFSQSVNQESGKFALIDVHKARQQGIRPLN
jgi:hypothetical protein